MKNRKKIALTLTTLLTPMLLLSDMDRCISCHGVDFELKALGKSKIVKNFSEAEIKAALDGYKRGEGGPLKELMMQEVNLGIDTDAMAGDIYHECRTPGFKEPSDAFVFQKRFSVRTLHKLKQQIKKTKSKEDKPKVLAQIKAAAFSMLTYDDLLKEKINLKTIPAHTTKMDMSTILKKVSAVKKCVDHSFSDEEIVKCRVDFVTLAVGLIRDQEKKIKSKFNKRPIFTGEGAVDISEYLK